MAHEKGSPNLPLIALFAVLSVGTLVALQPTFSSYFSGVVGKQQYIQQEARSSYYDYAKDAHAADEAALASGPVPIDRAMSMVAARRDRLPQIAPKPWRNREALAGWGAHPDFEALLDSPAPPEAEAAEAEVAPTAEGEAGAARTENRAGSSPAGGPTPGEGAPVTAVQVTQAVGTTNPARGGGE